MTLTCIMVTKRKEMILTDVSDTYYPCRFLGFVCALTSKFYSADVTKPEKSKILTLTWPVTSSVTSGSNVWPCTGSSRTGLSNGLWNLEIGPVVWEISGGGPLPPPPTGRVTIQTRAGRGLKRVWVGTSDGFRRVRRTLDCQEWVRRTGERWAELKVDRWTLRSENSEWCSKELHVFRRVPRAQTSGNVVQVKGTTAG